MHIHRQRVQERSNANSVSSQRSPTPQYSHPVLKLQQQIGNQAVQRLLKSRHIQAKLTIGAPNDKYEQEADRVADQVMHAPLGVSLGCMPEASVKRQPEEKTLCAMCYV